jgi:flagellar assembly protein FliH
MPVWTSLTPGEARSQASLLAALEQLEAEKNAVLAGMEQQMAAVRSEAYEAGRRDEETRHAGRDERMVESVARAVESFHSDRARYFAGVEREVVELALAIAARVLHRESQMDPLLLSGAVRVALGQLSESTEVLLRVPAAEAALWKDLVQVMPLALRPAVQPDDLLEATECRLESSLGTVNLGIRAQLEEIERGFFDLLEQRETVSRAATA